MDAILESNLFQIVIMPLAVVFITLYCERGYERKKRKEEEKVKSFLLFVDMDMKIKNIQMSLKDNVSYSIPSNSLTNEQANDILIFISGKLTIEDVNIINMFYNNYGNIENAVIRRKTENLPIAYELYQVAVSYANIYNNEDMIRCYNKLYDISTVNCIEEGYNRANLRLNLEREVGKAMEIFEKRTTI